MTMNPSLRKLALTTHVATSVGLLGSIAAFLALSIAALNSQDDQTIRASYLAMNMVARVIIVPLAIAALLTGLIQSLGTPWGVFKHYWVLAKLLIMAFATTILLIKLKLIGDAAHLATAAVLSRTDLAQVGMELRFHAAAGLLVLLVPTVLSIYKPRGLTPYGRRQQQAQKGIAQPPKGAPQRPSLIPGRVTQASSGGAITLMLGRMQVIGFAAAVLIVHLLILHISGSGHIGH